MNVDEDRVSDLLARLATAELDRKIAVLEERIKARDEALMLLASVSSQGRQTMLVVISLVLSVGAIAAGVFSHFQ